jgi:hypothetical protein
MVAHITHFEELPATASGRVHTDVECGYRIVNSGGQVLLQLDTYGSDQRQIPGKISQSLQLDADAARTLVRIALKAFPGLRNELEPKLDVNPHR